ncbi:MAG: HAD family hydrolase [Tissierellaceae bacterium]|nr:HAD family hydrolase [Tissierellaceae bacterium]
MIKYTIPGREDIEIDNVVLDYNGTIAVDGKLLDGVGQLLSRLKGQVNLYVLTADTYGTVEEECKTIGAEVLKFPKENAGKSKQDIVRKLGGDRTITVGNGFNDIEMFQESILSIGVIEGEGASGKLLLHADIVARSIIEALEIILSKDKVKATLRN